ncbi:MAG: DNA methyltransferase [Verrucomicrobiales bacterium]
MATPNEIKRSIEAHKPWLGYLQPDGLVVSAAALVDKGHYYNEAQRERQLEFIDHLEACQSYDEEEGTVEITDFKALATQFLGLPEQEWVDASDLGEDYQIPLKESREILRPTAALRWPRGKALAEGEKPYQILIKEHDGDFDEPFEVIENTWSTSATRRLERLLRETEIPIGILVSKTHLRLVYAPVGENAGSLTFHFADMLSTMGRPILGAFDLLFNREMLFIGEESDQLPALLKHSRDMQANVSIELARQVLDGLYDLVRGTQAADVRTGGRLLKHLLATNPNLIYEGQLNVLMRLVFLLFAEDRGLMPNSELYNQHYSVHALYERLRQDHALHHDTMDDRYGAWAQLLALFRLVFHGHRHGDLRLPPRYGYLFDPDRFPFLEGRFEEDASAESDEAKEKLVAFEPDDSEASELRVAEEPAVYGSRSKAGQSLGFAGSESNGQGAETAIPLIGDGTIFRLLQGLLFLNGERISYRTLDVEQIGSVYETMMGSALARAEGQTIAIRPQKKHGAAVNLNLDHVLSLKGAERHKHFTEETGRKLTGTRLTEFTTATTTDELLAALQGATANSSLIARNATPHLAQPGSLLLQPTDARRKSGSHYTPRKLTEPIARKALEPVLARLGDQPFPKEILDLKVCDPAVGSGAFLVEACRQLGDELVKAWAAHGGKPVIPPDEDEVLHARRLVAQRCLYGVDRNPMAADLAKLSLWLATLAKDHPFTFLAHAIRSGDSLVGLSKKQILAFHWDLKHESAKQLIFGQDQMEKAIKGALGYRREILEAGDYMLPEVKAHHLREAEEQVDKVRRAGDLAVLGFFSGSKPKERQEARDRLLERWLKATDGSGSEESLREGIALKAEILSHSNDAEPVAPFHWEIEFPEVFERKSAGFDVLLGNPPYAGKTTISTGNAAAYIPWLQNVHPESHGNADLAAHFFRRGFSKIREGGVIAFITTNTIAQGDTRESGLRFIRRNKGTIYSAVRRLRWPGAAAVIVSVVHIRRGDWAPSKLDGREVPMISAFLFPKGGDESPDPLSANKGITSNGVKIYGSGFLFDSKKEDCTPIGERDRLLENAPRNAERIFPYIGGEEVNDSPTHQPRRFAINFLEFPLARNVGELRNLPIDVEVDDEGLQLDSAAADGGAAIDWPDLLTIVVRRVKPYRDTVSNYRCRTLWWQYERPRTDYLERLGKLDRYLVCSRHQPNWCITFLPPSYLCSDALVLFALDGSGSLALFSSNLHELWARFFSGSMKDDLRYTATDCFDTFPFPENWDNDAGMKKTGLEYYDYRAELMVRNDEGLTKTYNRFHDPGETSPDIHKLRLLHAAMDRAVLDAYGWTNVPTDCEFIPDFTEEDDDGNEIPKNIRYRWPDEVRDDVLARLLALNAERYQQEVNAGLHAGKKTKATKPKKKATKKKAPDVGQPTEPKPTTIPLFPEEDEPEAAETRYNSAFARQLIAAEILWHCHEEPTMGRVKLQKLIHLCEHHGRFGEVGGEYKREAAGPFDRQMMFGVVSGLKQQKWFADAKTPKGTQYQKLEKAGSHQKYLSNLSGDLEGMHQIIQLFRPLTTQQCEIVSTLYAAWNDLLLDGASPTDDEIIHQASTAEWHENKEKIELGKWPAALKWMREKGIVPAGWGTRTNPKSTND